MGQLGFFDLNRRYESLTEKNDPLVPGEATLTPSTLVRIQVAQPGSRPQIAAYLYFPRSPE
jgi:hypothetical protein